MLKYEIFAARSLGMITTINALLLVLVVFPSSDKEKTVCLKIVPRSILYRFILLTCLSLVFRLIIDPINDAGLLVQ